MYKVVFGLFASAALIAITAASSQVAAAGPSTPRATVASENIATRVNYYGMRRHHGCCGARYGRPPVYDCCGARYQRSPIYGYYAPPVYYGPRPSHGYYARPAYYPPPTVYYPPPVVYYPAPVDFYPYARVAPPYYDDDAPPRYYRGGW